MTQHWKNALLAQFTEAGVCEVAHWFDTDIARMFAAPYPNAEPIVCFAQSSSTIEPIIRPAA